MKIFNLIFTIAIVGFYSCSYQGEEFSLGDDAIEVAIPVAYGKLTINDIIDKAQGDASLRIDGEGKLTALYSGELLRENSTKIFPPVPGFFEFPIADTGTDIPIPINADYVIDKGIFDNTSIYFKVKHDKAEVIKLIMKIPSVTNKENIEWQKEYSLDFTNTQELLTIPFNFNDWTAIPKGNKIRFEYEATRPNGEKIKLSSVIMKFDVLRFSYLEGYFGNHTFDIKGDIIKINIFDRWKSGGIEFEDPKIQLDVDNAFGFPVRSKVNQLTISTATGQLFNVESEYINKGIDFAYPLFTELGQIKNTKFQFNSGNSNIGTLFKDRVVQVNYDFDAVANPDGNVGQKNFYNASSYFSVKVDVELPMKLKSNMFTIADTVDVNFADFDQVEAASIKLKAENSFPLEMNLSAIFMDANGVILDELTPAEAIKIKAATLGSNGKTNNVSKNETFIQMDAIRFAKVKTAKKILLTASFDTSVANAAPIWFYSDYGLDLKLGAIVKANP